MLVVPGPEPCRLRQSRDGEGEVVRAWSAQLLPLGVEFLDLVPQPALAALPDIA